MRKKLLILPIALLLALTALNVNTIGVSAGEHPAIYVDPATTMTKELTVGMLYTISICTDYSDDVWGYEFTLSYDPSVLEGAEVVNGDLITEETGTTMFTSAGFDNTAGELRLTGNGFFFISPPAPLTSGPGTLAHITFRVVGLGTSDITLGPETKLISYAEDGLGEMFNIIDATTMPDYIQNGLFDNSEAPAYPPYPPVAVITGETDVKTYTPLTFSGADSYDPDGTAIINYKWDFGDETPPLETTDATVTHTYTVGGTYDVTLVVTDEQSQLSDPAYLTIIVKERATWAADLVKKRAWPEHHHFDQSQELGRGEDLNNTLYAKVKNVGVETVQVKVKFTIYDARGGERLGSIETTEITLESLQTTGLTAEFDTTEWGTPKYKVYLTAQCLYFDGTRWNAGEIIKAFSFAVVL